MLRFGTISDSDPSKGLARVFFQEDKIVSDWIPLATNGTFKNKYFHSFDIGEHVACLMDQWCEDGVILGAVYSEAELPEYTSQNKSGVKFENGDYFVYDRESKEYKVKVGTVEIEIVGNKIKLKNAAQDIKSILDDLVDAIAAITVVTAGVTSTVPVNVAAINLIKTRINALLA